MSPPSRDLGHWVLTVSSGVGPVEVRRFAALLAEELERRLPELGLMLESVAFHGPEETPRSVDLAVSGERARLGAWLGTHVLVARSEARGKRSRKRWFVGVGLREARTRLPPAEMDPRDLQVDCCRASGAGGQHLQKTASAVRVLHRPSGIAVRVQNERSQQRNRAIALELLAGLLAEREERAGRDWESRRRSQCLQVERGAPVRSWTVVEGRLVDAAERGAGPEPGLGLGN